MSRSARGTAVLLAALAFAGCNNSTTPTAPTEQVPILTESFAGTLTVNGAITHPFVVGTPSTVTVTLVTLSPDSEAQIGVSLGTWNTTTETCQAVISSDLATQGKVFYGTAQNSGAFCVRVYDVGRLSQQADYEVQVTHQ
jgi:uncharacterized membrane protein